MKAKLMSHFDHDLINFLFRNRAQLDATSQFGQNRE